LSSVCLMGGAKMATTQDSTLQIWDLWIPDVGAVGISFARGRLAATDTLLVHAAPQKLTVEFVDEQGVRVSRGQDLPRTSDTPMARLRRAGDTVTREDIWPSEADYGVPVLLAGDEVGWLTAWWNAPDYAAWRWSIELCNHR
jgi:hypothetical protein